MKTMNSIRLLALALAMSATSIVQASDINVQILSATVKDQKIADATLTLQKNGAQSVTATTNTQGQALLNTTFADSEDALLIVKKTGYSNLVVKCPCSGMTYALSPVMNSLDSIRIVLNWGEEPVDIDSHLVFPKNHIYFKSMVGKDATLDVDDRDSFGPETITIQRKHEGARYVYAVHDYFNRKAQRSSALSYSGAKVFVYIGQTLVQTYYVPYGQDGNLWTVFAVTEVGEFQELNTMRAVSSHDRLETTEFQSVIDSSSEQHLTVSAENQTKAKLLNAQGELAFRAKNFDEAIRLFQDAVALDEHYEQAYSNLGLSFQKVNRTAEALWANRKAITLAEGVTAATVRAGSYYNNGRIYEAAGQLDDALREYKAAKQEKSNTVYDDAILRVTYGRAK